MRTVLLTCDGEKLYSPTLGPQSRTTMSSIESNTPSLPLELVYTIIELSSFATCLKWGLVSRACNRCSRATTFGHCVLDISFQVQEFKLLLSSEYQTITAVLRSVKIIGIAEVAFDILLFLRAAGVQLEALEWKSADRAYHTEAFHLKNPAEILFHWPTLFPNLEELSLHWKGGEGGLSLSMMKLACSFPGLRCLSLEPPFQMSVENLAGLKLRSSRTLRVLQYEVNRDDPFLRWFDAQEGLAGSLRELVLSHPSVQVEPLTVPCRDYIEVLTLHDFRACSSLALIPL